MATHAIEQGPAGRRLAANVAERRKALGLDLAAVSERLGRLGRPMGVSALSKIEQGARRADADDVVALAVALETSLGWLLLSPIEPDSKTHALTPDGEFTGSALWDWATGKRGLSVDTVGMASAWTRPRADFLFAMANRPGQPNPLPGSLKPEIRKRADVRKLEAGFREAYSGGLPIEVLDTVVAEIRSEVHSKHWDVDEFLAGPLSTEGQDDDATS